MTQTILNGVSKKTRIDFLNGLITENILMRQYECNRKEAETFSIFGYNITDLIATDKATHNPLLKARLHQTIKAIKERQAKSSEQNKLSIEKLCKYRELALGIGLRKVISRMRGMSKRNSNNEVLLTLLLLEIVFANLSAKMKHISKRDRAKIYEHKDILLQRAQPLLEQYGWKYGYNDAAGKNASYIIYVYLPNGVQISWHTNNYYIYKSYPLINVEWDGQVCMTMEKLLTYIDKEFLKIN